MIRRYGILNDQIKPGDAMLFGIPYPCAFVCDADGKVTGRFFHDSYKKRDSPETLLDSALGHIGRDDNAPVTSAAADGVDITAHVRGGNGRIRQGMVRYLVISLDIPHGLHVYGQPAPEGMLPLTITVTGPTGLITLPIITPETELLRLPSVGVDLHVWHGRAEFIIPFYATGELASEVRPLDQDSIDLTIHVQFQACDDDVCRLPTTTSLTLTAPMDVVDIPKLAIHRGHGQREGTYDATPHMKRLIKRKTRRKPLAFLGFILRSLKLEREGRKRLQRKSDHPVSEK